MSIDIICILISSISFFAYTIYYFVSPSMSEEFKRFGLENPGRVIIGAQFLGAAGLLVGLAFHPILLISSFGLGLLMLLGLIVRIKQQDGILVSLPAFFYMGLNTYIFVSSIS